jgi:hypothetical protein
MHLNTGFMTPQTGFKVYHITILGEFAFARELVVFLG